MKKIISVILIIAAMVVISSCGTAVKVGQGNGLGYSTNEQIAKDKAFAAAMADLSYSAVTETDASTTVVVEDINGKPVESTTIKKSVFTNKKFTGVDKKIITERKNGGYRATATVHGSYEKD